MLFIIMKLLGSIKITRYRSKIFINVTLAVFILVFILSSVIYIGAQKTVIENIYNSNRQVLSQVCFNIEYMDEMVKNLCTALYYDPNVAFLLYNDNSNEDKNLFEITSRMDKIKTNVISPNSYIHSIVVNNKKNSSWYNSYSGLFTEDKLLKRLLEDYKIIPINTPIYRRLETILPHENDKYEYVFTYAFYDVMDFQKKPQGAIYVNVKAQWILDRIVKTNKDFEKGGLGLYVFSSNKEIVGRPGQDDSLRNSLAVLYDERVMPLVGKGVYSGFFSANIGGGKHFISYSFMKDINMAVLTTQTYKEAFNSLYRFRNVIFAITFLFIPFAFLSALFVYRRIYNPIGNLIKKIGQQSFPETPGERGRDEIGFLEEAYQRAQQTAIEYVREKSLNKNILKAYYLRRLINESDFLSDKDFQIAKEQGYFSFSREGHFVVYAFKLDNIQRIEEEHGIDGKLLMEFAVANIAGEVIGEKYQNEAIEMKNGIVAVIIEDTTEETLFSSDMRERIKKIQKSLQEYFKVSVSIAVSPYFKKLTGATGHYRIAADMLRYSYLLGYGCTIFPEDVKENIENRAWTYSFDKEKRLVEELRGGSIKKIEECLCSMFEDICKMNHSNIMLSVSHLASTLGNTVMEIDRTRIRPLEADGLDIYETLLEQDTIRGFHRLAMQYVEDYVKAESESSKRHEVLLDAIKEMVQAKYMDANLCTAQIAGVFKMAPAYVARIFKESLGISLQEYINEYRIERAAELLEKNSYSVAQVMKKVGIESDANFYRQFKKKYGTAPREYVLKKVIPRD